MSCHSLSSCLTSLAVVVISFGEVAVGDDSTSLTPLISKQYAYPSQIPYQVDPYTGGRGPQQGYNVCNSTTENQNSLCQTSFVNSLDDFCLWGPPQPGSTIGDSEGIEVAWCSKPGHGTRLIPDGALTGVQYLKTPDYVQVVGFINQSLVDIISDDFGGELDPHGDDMRGNPLGGLMYSNAFSGNNNTIQQIIEWHNFMGSNAFCIKVCDPAGANAADYCQHSYDRIGCAYNDPNNAQNGIFEICDSDSADFPGVYTSDGTVMTYKQPNTSLGPISTIPYTARIASSSNCQTFNSQDLYSGLPGATATPTALAAQVATTTTDSMGSIITNVSGRSVSGASGSGMVMMTSTGMSGSSAPMRTANSAARLIAKRHGDVGLLLSVLSSVFGVILMVLFA